MLNGKELLNKLLCFENTIRVSFVSLTRHRIEDVSPLSSHRPSDLRRMCRSPSLRNCPSSEIECYNNGRDIPLTDVALVANVYCLICTSSTIQNFANFSNAYARRRLPTRLMSHEAYDRPLLNLAGNFSRGDNSGI